jgi:hypothetical protein
MAEFRLTLLGAFTLSGVPSPALSKKAQVLLAFLAVPLGQAHRRDKLAGMLWSDRSEEAARQNLRQCLSAIRKVSEAGEALPIIAEGDLLRLDSTKVTTDVGQFEEALRSRRPKELACAAALYRGELLEGLNLRGEAFEEWLIGERRRLRTMAMEGLSRLLHDQERSGARDLSLDAFVRDLEAVVEAARLERFPLYGASQGSAFAAAYAAKHPQRVSGLILCGGWLRGWRKRLDPDEIERRKALSTLILRGWRQDNPAYRQIFSSLLIPDGNTEQTRCLCELERISTSPENARLGSWGEPECDLFK